MIKLVGKSYLVFIFLAVALNTLIEAFVIQLGFISYNVGPTFLGIAWFTYLLYVPWIILTYEVGGILAKKFRTYKIPFYFLVGGLFAFSVDQYATKVGLYKINFNSIFYLFGVPIEDFFAVGLMIAFSVSIASYLLKSIHKF